MPSTPGCAASSAGNQAVQRLLQGGFRLGGPGDRQEREAQDLASRLEAQPQGHHGEKTQPQQGDGPAAAHRLSGLFGPGIPLDHASRRFFESHLGVDLKPVRLHTDARSQTLAATLGARAITAGNDIGFAPGEYNPHTASGKRLLAHELTHAAQARGEAGPGKVVRGDFLWETPAERVRDLLQTTVEGPPMESRETLRTDAEVVRLVDEAIWGLYGPYLTRSEHLTEAGIVRFLNLGRYLQTLEAYQTERGRPALEEQFLQVTQAEFETRVAAGATPEVVNAFVAAARARGVSGLDETRPWNSTGPALSAWRRFIGLRSQRAVRTAHGRAALGVAEAFTERETEEATRINLIADSPSLIGALAHEAIHFYTSPHYYRAVYGTAVEVVPSSPGSVSVEAEAARLVAHPRFREVERVFLEGMTHYFTLQLLTEGFLRFAEPHTGYDAGVLAAAEIARTQGEQTVRRAFFSGDPLALTLIGLSQP